MGIVKNRVVRLNTQPEPLFKTPRDVDVILNSGCEDVRAVSGSSDEALGTVAKVAYRTPLDVFTNQVVHLTSDPKTQYRTPEGVPVVLKDNVVVVRPAVSTDSTLSVLSTSAYTVSTAKTREHGKDGNDYTNVSRQNQENLGRGFKTTTDITEIFNNPNMSIALDLNAMQAGAPKINSQPGVVSTDHAIEASNALRELCRQITKSNGSDKLTPFLLGSLQLALTYSTVREASYNDASAVTLATSEAEVLKYGDLKTTLYNVLEIKGYENSMRQYLRLFSLTTSHAIANGKLQPNEKVSMQHGVTKKWLPYTFDFMRPNYSYVNNNAVYAWQLAQETAFKRKQKSNQQEVHNTTELSRAIE
ncbi:major coat protein [Citrus associated ampelovirus 1]|nr:major coat protein [Citrus associated ampelovirus 1]